MPLQVRPKGMTFFALMGLCSLGLTAWSIKSGGEFNAVAYAPLWTDTVDLSQTASAPLTVAATIDTSYLSGHGHVIKLFSTEHDLAAVLKETDFEDLGIIAVVDTQTHEEQEVWLQSASDWSTEDEPTVLMGVWHPRHTTDLQATMTFTQFDERVPDGSYRVEVWAGVCGLEALSGHFLGLLAILTGAASAILCFYSFKIVPEIQATI
jgi:hypothetical protein